MPKLIRFVAQFDNDQEIVVEPSRIDEVEVSFEKGNVLQAGPLAELPKVVGVFMRLSVKAIVARATTRVILREDNLHALREVVAAAELWRHWWALTRPMQPEDPKFTQTVTLMLAAEAKLAEAVSKFSGLPATVEDLADGGQV